MLSNTHTSAGASSITARADRKLERSDGGHLARSRSRLWRAQHAREWDCDLWWRESRPPIPNGRFLRFAPHSATHSTGSSRIVGAHPPRGGLGSSLWLDAAAFARTAREPRNPQAQIDWSSGVGASAPSARCRRASGFGSRSSQSAWTSSEVAQQEHGQGPSSCAAAWVRTAEAAGPSRTGRSS
jgi:hypothetical protein